MRHLSSEQIHMKWTIIEKKYALRSITNNDLKVPEKPEKLKCLGFTYNGAKLFNQKIGYGKTSLHISHHNLFHIFSLKVLLSFDKSVKCTLDNKQIYSVYLYSVVMRIKMAPPIFGRSVNNIPTGGRGADYAHHIVTTVLTSSIF